MKDLLEYREARRQRQYDVIAALGDDLDDDEDPAVVSERLQRIRKERADRKRRAGEL
ncbi:hypothetical protein [Kribbella sp. NPDC051770]|uniref:hypothetical protein n=1 Tax=Kribbella sp. NPDC051770 TaxID=3155413 RepID=UPI003441B846